MKATRLARVQLDDQLLVDDRLHFFARRDMRDFSFERVAIDGQPIWHRHDLGKIEIAQCELPRFWFIFDRDLVAGFNVEGSDIDVATIDLDMAVGNQLASGVARVRQTQTVNHIVEPRFEQLEQGFAGHTSLAQRVLENSAKLPLKKTILVTKLLLFAQRDRVIRLLPARAFRSVHPRRIILPLERLRWSKNLDAVTAADLCFRSGISAHERSREVLVVEKLGSDAALFRCPAAI